MSRQPSPPRQPSSSAIASAAAPRPEHWEAHGGEAGVAQLSIPPDAQRDRDFEVFCTLSVVRGDSDDAWHEMRVLVNGSQEWQRREATHEGGRDSLDYRFRRHVPLGEPLRIVASSDTHRARRVQLSITADEDWA